jgi:tRNA threonylcarbamoyladenosine biosynthesis protein TsaB
MPKILAIDTSNAFCSVALNINDTISACGSVASRQHARELLPMIVDLLTSHGLQPSDLDAVAVTQGPGSFTGLRIGAAVAQGLAFGAAIPIVSVSTLAVLAKKAHLQYGCSRMLVCTYARENEVYAGVYLVEGAEVILQGTEVVASPSVDLFLNADMKDGWEAVGDAWPVFKAQLPCALLEKGAQAQSDFASDAKTLSILASERFLRGGARAAEHALPIYLKEQMDYQA